MTKNKRTLEKIHIKSYDSGEFDIYVIHKKNNRTTTYEEYEHLLNAIRLGFLDPDCIDVYIGMNKEQLIEDVRRYIDEIMFR